MAIENVAVTLEYHDSKVIGRITLTEEIEEMLAVGRKFVLGASVIKKDVMGPKVVGITLIPITAKQKP